MRRRSLFGAGLALVGFGSVYQTGAFDSVQGFRNTVLRSAGDENAYLGLARPPIATPGVPGNDLIEVTNNTDETLTVTVDIANGPGSESVDPTQVTLLATESQQFTGTIGVERASSGLPVDLDVAGSGDDIDVTVPRSVPVPTLAWQIADQTLYSGAEFNIQYDVGDVPNFDQIVVHVEDISESWGPSETFTSSTPSGVFGFPDSSDSGGTDGHDFDVTFEVYDADIGMVIDRQETVTADGSDEGEGEVGDEDDPQIDWVFVDDRSSPGESQGTYTVYYQLSNLDEFDEASVTFGTQESWATQTVSSSQQPIGVAEYDEGGTAGWDFDVTVAAENNDGLTVDTMGISDTADGTNPDNPDITLPDSPELTTHIVRDLSGGGQADWEVEYAIGNTSRFDHIEVRFRNLDNDWASLTETSTSNSGTISYDPEYQQGDQYEIRTRVYEERDGVVLPAVESDTVTDTANGNDP